MDLWAIGVILYMLLSGYPPFNGKYIYELLNESKLNEVEFPIEEFTEISEEAKDFISKLLRKKPENRITV